MIRATAYVVILCFTASFYVQFGFGHALTALGVMLLMAFVGEVIAWIETEP